MTPTITAAQRDPLNESDDLGFLLGHLGIGADGGPLPLTSSPYALRQVLPRLRDRATSDTSSPVDLDSTLLGNR